MRFGFKVLALIGFVHVAHAADVAIPDALKPWQGWVLHGEEFRRCPFFANRQPQSQNEFVCAWPERLTLNVSARGGDFAQRWQVFAESWIALPGNTEHWPREVRLNGVDAAVIARNGVPSVRLSPGSFSVSGKLAWRTRPEQLAIPAHTGLVELIVDGRAIAQPERPDNAVWLGKRREPQQQAQLAVQTYRLLRDDIPAMLTTQLRLQVSGEAREAVLGKALPDGFTPTAIRSVLPARIEADGSLRVQLRAGQWTIAIDARGATIASELKAPIADSGEEVWSYQANDRLRVTAIEGVPTIDPAQANAPGEWRGLPTYRLTKDEVLQVLERSRGLANQDDNQLELNRQLWFDFAHDGFTVVDNISGRMRRDWRLDMARPFALQSARAEGDQGNLLVTQGAEPSLSGVELRAPSVSMQTVGRLTQASGRLPATGWQTRFTSVNGQLHLPPGHRLLTAWGDVDARSAWSARWGLLDFFIVLIAAVAAWKLRGLVLGALTLGALVLVHQEQSLFAWLLVNVLIAVALTGAAPLGKLKTVMTWYRGASLAVLVLAFLPFALHQVRLGLYPQLEVHDGFADAVPLIATDARLDREQMPAAAPAGEAPMESDVAKSEARSVRVAKTFTREKSADVLQRYAPGTVVQTGPGMPSWRFNSYEYSWSGPVDADETVRFVIATPLWMFVWRVVGVVLLGAAIVSLLRLSLPLDRARQLLAPFTRHAATALVFIAIGATLVSNTVQAQMPSDSQLAELKARLTQPPVCAPNCAEALSANVTVTAERLELRLDVATLANVAVPIPTAQGRWEPDAISVDGQSAGAVYRDAQQQHWIPLKAGAHTLRISGRLAAAESIQLSFPQRPRVILVGGSGWEFSGISDDRLLTNTLELVRQRTAQSRDALSASAQFAPFVRVHRFVTFDLDWSVVTVVERIAPDKGAFTVEVPLLKDESILTPGMTVRERNGDRVALVGLSAGENSTTWNSALPRANSLQLAMSTSGDRSEHWSFSVSPIWNVQFQGVPQVAPENIDATPWTFDYFPRAGESLTLNVFRPEAVSGQTLAIDRVLVNANVGKRSTNTSLHLNYRSTQGGRHVIKLPKDAQVMSVSVDEVAVPVRPQDGELPLSLLPGAHRVAIEWQTDNGARWRTTAPLVDLQSPASNVTTQIDLGYERWVLFARGQGVGPAILYWGELLVFIVLAVLLARYTQSPLKMHDWLLLGLGLSTFSWAVLMLFAAWIFAMRWRSAWPADKAEVQFNVSQLALGLLTVITVGALVSAIPIGLLGQPDMSVRSPTGGFAWFVDQSQALLPNASVFSVPLIVYKVAILLWALWLSFALIRWLPWAWRAFNHQGLWRGPIARKSAGVPPAG